MDMQYRRLGNSGLQVSALSFGSWVTFANQVDDSLATEMIKLAYDRGVNFFDNAEVYAHGQSEEIMGRVIEKLGLGRDTYCVSSKVYWGGSMPTQRGLSRKHVFDACHAALKRLRVDYLDLYFCHRPDLDTPIAETVNAMSDLVRQGKVLYWGTSEWSAVEIMEAHAVARENNLIGPTMEQPEYNLFHRERVEAEYAHLYDTVGLGTTIWSPLASGILTGKYKHGIPDDSRMNLKGYEWLRRIVESDGGRQKIQKAAALEQIADDLGITMVQLALAWCLKNPNVSTVILGASKVSQLEQNFEALAAVEKLDDGVMDRIEAVVDNKPAARKDWKA
jgi:voltage-dependent potassium channel beta subunit